MNSIENLAGQAREYGIPEAEVLRAWEEMRRKHRLPFYVEPTLETSLLDGSVMLQPAVNINLMSRVLREVPGFETISGPVWPSKKGPETQEVIDLLATTESNPRKFCCRKCGECAPLELLQEGKFPERIAWLRHHYKEKHPGIWGKGF